MGFNTHKDLDIWGESIDLVERIYKITDTFPQSEMYGLTNQMRRSAVSIPSNISEGAARSSNKEFIQFLYISLGSLSELETHLIISSKLRYMEDESIFGEIEILRRKLLNFIKYRKTKPNRTS
jgi:four helix bundle protein